MLTRSSVLSFLTDSLLINEIAPRPHNSGHHTIEACHTSQFENHLRAITFLPLGSTALRVPATAMVNLIGLDSTMDSLNTCIKTALAVEGAAVHMYGKAECRKGRKMGHITVTANSDDELIEKVRPILEASLPSSSKLPAKYCPPQPASGLSSSSPLVGIIMGSDSDLPTMAAAAQMLELFKVPYELTIVSAHRTPDRMVTYAREAAGRGLRAIIAGAGGAAHLPGMVAAMTALPVIGVPVKGSVLDGVDSLHSIVQMPVSCQCFLSQTFLPAEPISPFALILSFSEVSPSPPSPSATRPTPAFSPSESCRPRSRTSSRTWRPTSTDSRPRSRARPTSSRRSAGRGTWPRCSRSERCSEAWVFVFLLEWNAVLGLDKSVLYCHPALPTNLRTDRA